MQTTTLTRRSNADRIGRALELETLALRYAERGDVVWADRFRRNARLLRRIVARKCAEAA